MGRDLYEKSRAARAVFDCAEKIRPGTIEQCFSGGSVELARTENTQPCLYCVDLAAASALREAGVSAGMLAGFSLGELAALAFSGAITYEDGFKLVCKRAELMQKASEAVSAGMVAVLTLSDSQVAAICGEFGNVYPVNFNCDGQVVVAGRKDDLEPFLRKVKESGGKAISLKVGGGFHSPLMAEASEAFAAELSAYDIRNPEITLYSNCTSKPYDGDVRELLSKQMRSPVLWRDTVENMILAGADTFIEAGPGKTLSGLISRISRDVRVFNVEDSGSLETTVASHPGVVNS